MFDTNELTFGSDPEVFAHYLKDNIPYVEPPAYFRMELGVPYKPDPKHPSFIEKDGIVVMEDGVAFEFTLPPTTEARPLFAEIKQAQEMLNDFLSRYNYSSVAIPTINYEVQKFLDKDNEYQLCLIFGCDPDKDAIETTYKCNTINALLHPFRYGGGHFQVGSFNPEVIKLLHHGFRPMIQLMAVLVGTVCVKNSDYPELEYQRSFIYGRPGRYRIQKWGLEYRTPSNSWINKEATLEEMVNGARYAFQLLQNPTKGRQILKALLADAITSIRNSDQTLAANVLSEAYSI